MPPGSAEKTRYGRGWPGSVGGQVPETFRSGYPRWSAGSADGIPVGPQQGRKGDEGIDCILTSGALEQSGTHFSPDRAAFRAGPG